MGISVSTMTCPTCEKQVLETLSTPFGTWERCPNCTGLFIHEKLIISASADRATCEEALKETEGLLLPTDRTCPKCLQKLFDGRVQSRGVIFSLCPTCDSLWTTLPTLRQFEETIEKTLTAEIQAAGVGAPGYGSGATTPSKFYEDSGLASLFRGFARVFDRVADSFRPSPSEDDSILKEEKALKKKKKEEAKTAKKGKPEKLIKSVEPAPPAAVPQKPEPVKAPEPESESPVIEIPDFIFPEEPPEPVAEPPKAEPIQEPKPTPVPAPVPKTAILSGSAPKAGFFAKLKAAWSPKPKKVVPKPVATPKPAEPPKPKAVEPPKPTKPAPVPKPKKEKPPREPFDHVAFWPPWVLGVSGVLLSGLRDYGFEGAPAFLWGVMGWAIGMMVRAKRLYPTPVVLKGQIVPAREEDPKGVLVFKQDTGTVALNKIGRWDVIPRLFGLSNPRQLLKGDVTLTGWPRAGLVPSIEIHEIRADKAFRKSMTKVLRWIFAVLVFVVALGIYLSLD